MAAPVDRCGEYSREVLTIVRRHGDRVAAAKTKGSDSAMNIAAHHFINQPNQDAGTAGADGVPDRNRAACHVHLAGSSQPPSSRPTLHGKASSARKDRLLFFPAASPARAGSLQRERAYHLGSMPLVAWARMWTIGASQAMRLLRRGHHHHCGSAIIDAGRIAAVTVRFS